MSQAARVRWDNPIALAMDVHQKDVDRNGEPYFSHIQRVFNRVAAWWPGDEDLGWIATLHDAVEDHPEEVNVARLSLHFGARVAEGVDALTRRDGEDYDDFIVRVGQNHDAVRVKIADLIDNLRPGFVPLRLTRRYMDALGYLLEKHEALP